MSSQFAVAVLLQGLCFVWCTTTMADSPCGDEPLTEVQSLAKLPVTLRQVLPIRTEGLKGIADSGAPFISGDAITLSTPQPPMMRFDVAAVGKRCAIIAVEHGGQYHVTLTEYHFGVEGWRVAGPVRMAMRSPKSMQELLSAYGSAPRCPEKGRSNRTCIENP